MAKAKWVTIDDSMVRHVWKCEGAADGCKQNDQEVTVSPAFYEDAGTPICEECGWDLVYVRTEITKVK